MTFKDGPWSARFEKMGDEAEAVFEHVAEHELNLGFVRYGLSRPPLQMHRLPARVRYTPDYLMSGKFIEVQGFGRDRTLKLKLDKHGALHWWADVHPVELFVWDSHHRRWCFVSLAQLDALLATEAGSLDAFPEQKPYFAFDGDAIFAVSECVGTIEVAA